MKIRVLVSEMTKGTGIKGYVKRKLYSYISHCFHAVLDVIDSKENVYNARFQENENKLQENENKLQENKNKLQENKNKLDDLYKKTKFLGEQIDYLTFSNNNLKDKLKKLKADNLTNANKEVTIEKNNLDNDYANIDYFDFENHFRGSIEEIKKRQEMYIDYFIDKENVLDIGCGRGEFLHLMKANGVHAKGIDIYEEYADYCKSLGLEAMYGDGITYLHNSEEEFGGIFVGQVIEHLDLNQIVSICNDAYKKLKTGASIVLESPNPRCLSTYTNSFYVDPTHVKPVHPLTMQYFLEKAGFKEVKIVYTSCSRVIQEIPKLEIDVSDKNKKSLENFNNIMHEVFELLYGSQDYAIIATK